MTSFTINIYYDSKNEILHEALSGFAFPQGLNGGVRRLDNEIPSINEGTAALFVTDSLKTVKTFASDKPERSFLVYCGKYIDAAPYMFALDELWPMRSDVTSVELRVRCEWLLKNILGKLNAGLYRNALFSTINAVPNVLWYRRQDGVYEMVNDAYLKTAHTSINDAIGRGELSLFKDMTVSKRVTAEKNDEEEDPLIVGSATLKGAGGVTKKFNTYEKAIRDPLGNQIGTVGVCADLTSFERISFEFSIIIENIPYPMAIFTRNWKTVGMNRFFKEYLDERTAGRFNYRRWKKNSLVLCGDPRENLANRTVSQDYKYEANGRTRYFTITEFDLIDYFGNTAGHFCTLVDHTDRMEYEKQILEAANTDMLTGMYNRRYFYDYMTEHKLENFNLLYLDLDNFKAINDTYGHDVGDEVLVRTSQLIEKYFPEGLRARLGGDEFAVIDDTLSEDELQSRCEKLESTVTREFRMYECGIGISIGVAHNEGSVSGIDMLLHESDVKMYEMKKHHHSKK